MKKLEDFQKNQVDVDTITGGIGGAAPHIGSSVEKPGGSADCCYIASDSFTDENNNGLWDGSEWGNQTNWQYACD